MELCDLCTHLTEWLATLDLDREVTEDSDYGWMHKVWVMPAKTDASATLCHFCMIWMTKIKHALHWHHLMLPRFYLRVELWCFPKEFGHFLFTPDINHANGQYRDYMRFQRGHTIELEVPDSYWGTKWKGCKRVWMGVTTWTDNGDNESKLPNPRRTTFGPRFEYICNKIRGWIQTCALNHDACPDLCDVPLPSRVLMVQKGFKNTDPPLVKLIESQTLVGTYCALSHCWGSNPYTRPLRTTRQNLEQYLAGIPFDDLAKTFQDAVMLSLGIGISYIWIDSLCIIQDDHDDWHREAQEMGRIYRDAALVIAASGAEDATEGLFIREAPFMMTARPVVRNCRWSWYRPFNAALLPEREHPYVERGPLFKRAWAFQERYLAARLVMFMPTTVTWSCEEHDLDDLGATSSNIFPEKSSWQWLLFEYSRKELTYKTDRLYALRGIVNEIQNNREDDFCHSFGVWSGSLHSELLWRHEISPRPEDALEHLPTWSWAATGGVKILCPFHTLERSSTSTPPKNITNTLRITSKGSIKTKGYLGRPVCTLHIGSEELFSELFNAGAIEGDTIPGAFSRPNALLLDYFVMLNHGGSEKATGIAVFDCGSPITSAKCYFLASSERNYPEWSLPFTKRTSKCDASENAAEEAWSDNEDEMMDEYGQYAHLDEWEDTLASDTGRSPPHAHLSGEGDNSCNEDPNSIITDDISESEKNIDRMIKRMALVTKFVYWALLLEPTGEGTYKRVGLAMLYPHAPVALDARLADIEIV